MKRLSLSALVAAGVLAGMTGANAADLGGNCCADLEERIAELEATTARKGNRKVSLTISGWVTQQVAIWDDGVRTKAYVSDAGTTLASHVTLSGQAQINTDWSAGYVMHIEAVGNDPLGYSQTASDAGFGRPAKTVNVFQSFWFVKSNTIGKLSIGLQSSAGDNVAIYPDGSGSLVPANYVLFDNNSFFLRTTATKQLSGQTWGNYGTCPKIQTGVVADCDGVPNNNIRYDTPTFGGFSASASWGEADIWDIAGRYAGEFNGVKLAAAIAYTESTDGAAETDAANGKLLVRRGGQAVQIGAYIEHVPTGLFVYGAYGKDFNGDLQSAGERAAFGNKTDGDNFYLKAGARIKHNSLGHTVLFAEYGESNDKQSLALFQSGVTGSSLTQWGLGVVQEIDAAAMSVWFMYRNFSLDQNCNAVNTNTECAASLGAGKAGKTTFEDFSVFKLGGLINF